MNRKQALASLQAFLPEDKEIIKMINLCDLHPIDESPSGWRKWCNQYSPYISVQKNKKLVTRWKGQNWFATQNDLYAYSEPQQLAKMSKKLLFITEKDCFCLLFWGNDNIFRYRRYFSESMCFSDPPLFLPIEDLRKFIKLESIDNFEKIRLTKKSSASGWVTSWPPKKEFYQEIKGIVCNNQVESLILENIIAENNTMIISLK